MSKLDIYFDKTLPETSGYGSSETSWGSDFPRYENTLRQFVDDIRREKVAKNLSASRYGYDEAAGDKEIPGKSEPTQFDKLISKTASPEEKLYRHYEYQPVVINGEDQNFIVRDELSDRMARMAMQEYNPTFAHNIETSGKDYRRSIPIENLEYYKKMGVDLLGAKPSKININPTLKGDFGQYNHSTDTIDILPSQLRGNVKSTYIHELQHKIERDKGRDDQMDENTDINFNATGNLTGLDQDSNNWHLTVPLNTSKDQDLAPKGERALFYNLIQNLKNKSSENK